MRNESLCSLIHFSMIAWAGNSDVTGHLHVMRDEILIRSQGDLSSSATYGHWVTLGLICPGQLVPACLLTEL